MDIVILLCNIIVNRKCKKKIKLDLIMSFVVIVS